MFITRKFIDRRTVLRGVGAVRGTATAGCDDPGGHGAGGHGGQAHAAHGLRLLSRTAR